MTATTDNHQRSTSAMNINVNLHQALPAITPNDNHKQPITTTNEKHQRCPATIRSHSRQPNQQSPTAATNDQHQRQPSPIDISDDHHHQPPRTTNCSGRGSTQTRRSVTRNNDPYKTRGSEQTKTISATVNVKKKQHPTAKSTSTNDNHQRKLPGITTNDGNQRQLPIKELPGTSNDLQPR